MREISRLNQNQHVIHIQRPYDVGVVYLDLLKKDCIYIDLEDYKKNQWQTTEAKRKGEINLEGQAKGYERKV